MAPRYPSLYQINTRVWLTNLSAHLQRPATLDDVGDDELDRLAGLGFDWIWLLSVWQTGAAGRRVSRANPEWRREFQHTLADLTEDDIAGSGFAITAYETAAAIGGDAALARFRDPAAVARHRADARLRPESHGARPSLGRRAPRLLRWRHRGGPGGRAGQLRAARDHGGRAHLRVRARPVLCGLARHAADRLRESCRAGGDARRRSSRSPGAPTACGATWRCSCCPRSSSAPGDAARSPSGRMRSPRSRPPRPASASWPRSIGISSGRCSSRASTTPTTSACTTGCAKAMPGPCASTFTRGSTIRTGSRGSWRTTTSRAPPRPLPPASMRPPPPSRSSRPDCASSTRGSSRGGRPEFPHTWCARLSNRLTPP